MRGCWLLAALMSTVPASAARPEGPVLWVLSVGAASHRFPEHNLRFAGADARAMAAMLHVRGQGVFAEVRTVVLTGRRAVVPKILSAAAALRPLVKPSDTVLFFYSGHGGIDPKHGFQFITWEAQEGLPETVLRWRDLAGELNRLPAGHLVIAVDACEAGAVLTPEPTTQRLALAPSGGLAVLASSRFNEDSLELPDQRHGAYTVGLLEALAGGAADAEGRITLGAVDRYVRRRVETLTKGEQRPWPLKLRGASAEAQLGARPPAE